MKKRASSTLTRYAEQYRENIAARQKCLVAVERYYRELLVYQWRLDALDALSQAVVEVTPDSNVASGGSEASDARVRSTERRRAAFDKSLEVIQSQEAAAIASLEERTSHYAVVKVAASGSDRLATTGTESEVALESLRQLARDTYSDINNEACDILQVMPGDDGLRRLRSTLERRRGFWQRELEETWEVWQSETARMHHAGEEAVSAWTRMASLIESMQPQFSEPIPASIMSLAVVVARGLEVELVEPLGLSGLHSSSSCDAHGQEEVLAKKDTEKVASGYHNSIAALSHIHDADKFSVAARVSLFVCVLGFLQERDALHLVGMAMLTRANDEALMSHSSSSPLLPQSVVNMMVSRKVDRSLNGDASLLGGLSLWMMLILVDTGFDTAVCSADWTLQCVLDFCEKLGGAKLVEGVLASESQRRDRKGTTLKIFSDMREQIIPDYKVSLLG